MKKRKLTLIGALIVCVVVIAIKELINLPEYNGSGLKSLVD
jgi:Tfp pilus assembly protein PilE